MIVVTIREEAERRGIKTPYGLAKNLGVGQSKAARLWEGARLPKLETLGDICELWGCDLGALVHYAPKLAQKTTRRSKKR